MARREEGAYSPYVTDEQRRQRRTDRRRQRSSDPFAGPKSVSQNSSSSLVSEPKKHSRVLLISKVFIIYFINNDYVLLNRLNETHLEHNTPALKNLSFTNAVGTAG
jgi:hypothetical protein